MGAEAQCRAEYNGRRSRGTALLETDHVLFRGEYRVKVLFTEIVGVSADAGRLIVLTDTGELQLELGPAAQRWKQKIENPPSLLTKLGVKSGTKVTASGAGGEELLRSIGLVSCCGKADLVFLKAEDTAELTGIPTALKCITRAGALWIIYPKGRRHIREIDVIQAGRSAGLKDVKVASFSTTHTALKFVLPAASRHAE